MNTTKNNNVGLAALVVALLLGVPLATGMAMGAGENQASAGFSVEATNIPLENESLVSVSISGSEAEPVRALSDTVDLAISVPESSCSGCSLALEADDQTLASFAFDLDPDGIEVWDLYLREDIEVPPENTIFRFTMGSVEGLVGFIATSLEETSVELKIDLDASGGPYTPDERVEVPERGEHDGRVVYSTSLAVRSLPVVSWSADFGDGTGETARGEVNFLRNQVTGSAEIGGDTVRVVYARAERTSDLLAAELTASAFRPQIEPDWEDGGSGTERRWAALGVEEFDAALLAYLESEPVRLGFDEGAQTNPTTSGGSDGEAGGSSISAPTGPGDWWDVSAWLLAPVALLGVAAVAGGYHLLRRRPRIQGGVVSGEGQHDFTGQRRAQLEHTDDEGRRWGLDLSPPGPDADGGVCAYAEVSDAPGPVRVDGMSVERGDRIPLHHGSQVVLGDETFRWEDPDTATVESLGLGRSEPKESDEDLEIIER